MPRALPVNKNGPRTQVVCGGLPGAAAHRGHFTLTRMDLPDGRRFLCAACVGALEGAM